MDAGGDWLWLVHSQFKFTDYQECLCGGKQETGEAYQWTLNSFQVEPHFVQFSPLPYYLDWNWLVQQAWWLCIRRLHNTIIGSRWSRCRGKERKIRTKGWMIRLNFSKDFRYKGMTLNTLDGIIADADTWIWHFLSLQWKQNLFKIHMWYTSNPFFPRNHTTQLPFPLTLAVREIENDRFAMCDHKKTSPV